MKTCMTFGFAVSVKMIICFERILTKFASLVISDIFALLCIFQWTSTCAHQFVYLISRVITYDSQQSCPPPWMRAYIIFIHRGPGHLNFSCIFHWVQRNMRDDRWQSERVTPNNSGKAKVRIMKQFSRATM